MNVVKCGFFYMGAVLSQERTSGNYLLVNVSVLIISDILEAATIWAQVRVLTHFEKIVFKTNEVLFNGYTVL